MASNKLGLHQPGEHWKDGQKGEDAEEHQHPNAHTLLVFLILLVFLDTIRIFTDTFFGFWRNINATNTTMLVRRNVCLRFGTLWHVLDFLLHS